MAYYYYYRGAQRRFLAIVTKPLQPDAGTLIMIVIIGAGGETSRRIIQLAREQGLELRLGARDPDRLKAALGQLADGFQIRRMNSEDKASVAEALQPGDVLINGATPAGSLGHGLARIAIERKAHYVSFTGEVLHARRLMAELDGRARESGVTLCPGAGYSGGTGDLALRLALRKLPKATQGFTGYAAGGFTPSYGTLISEMQIMDGPGLVICNGSLVEEPLSGSILEVAGQTLVCRPLMDPLMVSTYSRLNSFKSGIQVPKEYAAALSQQFAELTALLKTPDGRTQYMQKIEGQKNRTVSEDEQKDRGVVTAYLSYGSEAVQVSLTTHPVYEQTARVALLAASELGHPNRPAGFQAVSSIVRSLDHAVERLGSAVVG